MQLRQLQPFQVVHLNYLSLLRVCFDFIDGVVGRGVLLIGRGLDGQAEGWDIREKGDVEAFGGTWALIVPRNVSKNTQKLTLIMPK